MAQLRSFANVRLGIIRYRNAMSALRRLFPCERPNNRHRGMSQTCQGRHFCDDVRNLREGASHGEGSILPMPEDGSNLRLN